jgi:PHD-finger
VVGLFDEAALEELLSVAPTPESAQCVWRIAEALPALHAARRLLSGRMRLLASGELLPPGVDATAAIMAAVGDDNARDGGAAAAASAAAAELACLAAAATGPKLSALLAASLGLAWPGADAQHRRVVAGGSGKHSHPPTAAPKAAAAAGEEEERDGDDLACGACGSTRPANTMLLCDGCDAALHTTCLDPPLEAVPEGDWLCPHCVTEVAAGAPSAGDALTCIALLLSSDSGRALLSRGGLLAAALPLLEREATAELASARRGADTAAARSGAAAATAAAGLAASAGALALLHARATLHSLALDQEAPMRLAAVTDGA